MKDRRYYVPISASRIDGKLIQNLRRKYGITRKEFSLWTGISYSTLDCWECGYKGNAPLPYLYTLMKAYILQKQGIFNIDAEFERYEHELGISESRCQECGS